MADIVLTTINAKYIHTSFGLRYLKANLNEIEAQCEILEFDKLPPIEIAAELIKQKPKIIGIGVYIWNAAASLELASILKNVCPEIKLVLGGPEISYETESQEIYKFADHIITGEADLEFYKLCKELLSGQTLSSKVLRGQIGDLKPVRLPYYLYTDQDIKNRLMYVEASRGCPFTCEFCLSSLDIPVRQFDIDEFLKEIGTLIDRGARHLKFVDRTFNLNIRVASRILEFCLSRYKPGMFFHFEMVPDRLPKEIKELLKKFPPGSIQLEVGIQTFNPSVSALISRRQDYQKLEDNIKFLRTETNVHIHADLIAGLPGESLESFGEGFDRLASLNPHEIQVGILKRLKGTPIIRHDLEFAMKYSYAPPYEILSTSKVSFSDLQRLRNFSRYWDLIANSGRFIELVAAIKTLEQSIFKFFLGLSDFIYSNTNKRSGLRAADLAELVVSFCKETIPGQTDILIQSIERDFIRTRSTELPSFLAPPSQHQTVNHPPVGPKRQRNHSPISPGSSN